MSNVDLLFIGILRFSAIALILLSTSVLVLQFLKQPLERIRLIQITLLGLIATMVVGAACVLPRIELAVLPTFGSSPTDAATSEFSRPARLEPHVDAGERSRLPSVESTDVDTALDIRSDRTGSSSDLSEPRNTAIFHTSAPHIWEFMFGFKLVVVW